MIVLNEQRISQIGGATNVRPKKYMLLLIPYNMAGTRKRNDVLMVAQQRPCFEIGHFPPSLKIVVRSLTKATIITSIVCGMGNRPSL